MNTSKQSKGKPITTSVPTFAIRFHAGGEELEELYPSEDEDKSEKAEKPVTIEEKSNENVSTGEPNKHESSPMRDYLKFGKRSSSIDTGINESTLGHQTAASDPWRLFSEFKGKLTKTVEEKLSEIKSKNNENESSPKHLNKSDKNKTSSSKENSSVSDSEEQSFSECSIPKSSGLSSTAEDIEMSSEDENSLAESDKTPTENITKEIMIENSPSKTKKHIFRHKSKDTKSFVKFSAGKDVDSESQVKITSLSTVHEKEDTVPEDDVESGVEACEEFSSSNKETVPQMKPDSLTLIAPSGFFDVRPVKFNTPKSFLSFNATTFWSILAAIIAICIVFPISRILFGFILGILVSTCFWYLYIKFNLKDTDQEINRCDSSECPILEIQPVKEYQPVTRFEGWLNEYPEPYDPVKYHIMQTQPVFLKLEGSVLRIYHTRANIPKRAMWNEPKHNVIFTHTRIFNLRGSQIALLPAGLIPKRLWSKKYPICIILNKEKMSLDLNIDKKDDLDSECDKLLKKTSNNQDNEIYADPLEDSDDLHPQLSDVDHTEDEMYFLPDPNNETENEEIDKDDINLNDDWDTLTPDDSSSVETKIYLFSRTCRDKEEWYRRLVQATQEQNPEEEKCDEDSISAPVASDSTDASASTPINDSNSVSLTEQHPSSEQTVNNVPVIDSTTGIPKRKPLNLFDEKDYMRYMAKFQKVQKHFNPFPHALSSKNKLSRLRKKKNSTTNSEDEESQNDLDLATDTNYLWLNMFISRVFYDVCRHDKVIDRFLCLIQRKLSTIKLPYFIEDIVMTDLNLGKSSPTIHQIYEPHMDERGLWIYMDVVYEGVTSMAIVTKLNLMKLKELAGKQEDRLTKEPAVSRDDDRSPIFHSDVEDSAESSDDEPSTSAWNFSTNSSDNNSQNSTPRKPSTGGKKFLLMVDKIASSKYFQQATEIKYIKRALEGVSNTEIKLAVEVQHLSGTLAINVPSPPSDRVWMGFRGNPNLQLSAHPAFGERSINFLQVTKWIEKKLVVEFQKFFVLPNMEDFVLPAMIPTLPE